MNRSEGVGVGEMNRLNRLSGYRYIALIWTSVVYLLSRHQEHLQESLLVIGSLIGFTVLREYLYQHSKKSQKKMLSLIGFEIIGNCILLIISGGAESPFIWYSANTLIIIGIEFGGIYLWMNTFIYLIVMIETSKLLHTIKKVEQMNIITAFILLSAAIGVVVNYVRKVEYQRKQVEQYLTYTMQIYQVTYGLASTKDYKHLADILLKYIVDTIKSPKVCISICDEDNVFVRSNGLNDKEIMYFSRETKLCKIKGNRERHKVITYEKDLIGVCIGDAQTYYGMIFLEGTAYKENLIFLAYISSIVIKNFNMEKMNQEILLHKEQSRIANEIHDGILQKLFGLSCQSFMISKKIQDGVIKQSLDELREGITDAMTELRRTVYGLSWDKDEEDALVGKLTRYINFIEKCYGAKIQFITEGEMGSVPVEYEKALYSIVCESIANAVRHGKAECITVCFKYDQDFYLYIHDNGCGFDYDQVMQNGKKGLGIDNMKQLVQTLKGTIDIQSKPNQGTEINVVIPMSINKVSEGIG